MNCEVCGSDFRPSGRGKTQRFCSAKCRQKAYRLRSKHVKRDSDKAGTEPSAPKKELGRREFERMMDDSLEDVLRLNRDRLKNALADPGTPANALAAISRQLIAICERLDQVDDGGGLFDEPEDAEAVEDVGMQVV